MDLSNSKCMISFSNPERHLIILEMWITLPNLSKRITTQLIIPSLKLLLSASKDPYFFIRTASQALQNLMNLLMTLVQLIRIHLRFILWEALDMVTSRPLFLRVWSPYLRWRLSMFAPGISQKIQLKSKIKKMNLNPFLASYLMKMKF